MAFSRCAYTCLFLLASLTSCATDIARQAQRAYEKGEYEKASQLYEQATKKFEKPQYYYNQALSLIAEKKSEQALGVLDKVLSAYPKNLLLLHAAILASFEIKNFKKTKIYIDRVLDINPIDTQARVYSFRILYAQGNRKTAIKGMKNLYKETQDPRILAPISEVSYQSGNKKEAIFWLKKATEAQPTQSALFLLAQWQIESRDYLEAEKNLIAGLGYSESALHRFTLAKVYLVFIKNKELGLEALKMAIQAGYPRRTALSELMRYRTVTARREVQRFLLSGK